MDHLNYSHYFSLPSQGNVYTMANLELADGSNKLLVASLKREIFCFEYLDGPDGQLIPTSREVSFTYIPTGAEIISLDAYNKSSEKNEFVVGITIIKNSSEQDSVETYLNIYSGWEASEDFNIENIAQNCQNVELNFTPYILKHTDLMIWDDENIISREKVFLLSGSDHVIHVFLEGPDHLFKEIDAKEYFPEFTKHPSPVVWVDVMHINNESQRLVAIGCECGYVRVTRVCGKTKKILFNFSCRLDNYISHVRLYKTDEGAVNMIVINSVLWPLVFSDIITFGLSNYYTLPRHTSTTVVSCCELADIDLDGNMEILVGNSSNEVVLYKYHADKKWWLEEVKEVSSPIFAVKYVDLTGDGVREMIVYSMKGVHVFQLDPDFVQNAIEEKMKKLTEADLKTIKGII
ncbi:hypothetical protein HHI36_000032 [Cryptolaemus montrouzieri]|uniref:KICSTOR complex protein kaptin-like n=1 Tax=Cryptolaemus montrouzieri TaxID=559131 RepID=A0ABD2P4I0_9CUCU